MANKKENILSGEDKVPEGENRPKESTFPLERAFEQLEDVIGRLQDNEISLADAFKEYELGMRLLKRCNEAIDRVEKQVLKISESGELCEFE